MKSRECPEARGEGMTPEREAEIKRRIDGRFDQFSLDELRDATSGAMTFRIAFLESFTPRERQFAERYFSQKIDELRVELSRSEAEGGGE